MVTQRFNVDELHTWYQRLTDWMQTQRLWLKPFIGLVFIVASVWAWRQLNLSVTQFEPLSFAVLFFLLSPLSLLYGAIGLSQLAAVAGSSMRFSIAFRASVIGQLAEILPLPGGAIVRTDALIRSGVDIRESAVLVTATAILWITLAAAGAGLIIAKQGYLSGMGLGAIGAITSIIILIWIARRAGALLTSYILAHRLIGLFLMAARLSVAFAILRQTVPFAETLPYVFAAIVGSAASIAPGGFGISELLAALIATGLSVSPAAALVAVALNRLIALVSMALVYIALETCTGKTENRP